MQSAVKQRGFIFFPCHDKAVYVRTQVTPHTDGQHNAHSAAFCWNASHSPQIAAEASVPQGDHCYGRELICLAFLVVKYFETG